MSLDMQNDSAGSEIPAVSIIIPARNEEVNLEKCLRSLVVQRGVPFEILVVDDSSTDRTLQIAESFTRAKTCPVIGTNSDLLGVRVLLAPDLQQGITGKSNACAFGAANARGRWLLFTDADTVHVEGSLATALSEAQSNGADLLSYSPEQEVTSFAQAALMPVIFAELATVYRPRKVSDPKARTAAANGQYLLVRREVYEAVGGHSAVASSLLEDVALAELVKSSGHKLCFRFGRGIVRAHMYRNWSELRSGWTKNLVLLFPEAARLALKRASEFVGTIALMVAAIISLNRNSGMNAAAFALLAAMIMAAFYRRIRRAHFGFVPTVLSFIGLPMFAYLLLCSREAHQNGAVAWKGRTYDPTRSRGTTNDSSRSLAAHAGK